MSLDNFRNRTILWDTVNKDFPQPIQVMQGDVNARTLLIKIVDNGTEIDLTGHSLKLTYQYTNNSNMLVFFHFLQRDSEYSKC